MLKLGTLRWKGRCSKHPRYDPAEDGEGGIRGGCQRCLRLLDIYQQHGRLVRLMREFGPLRERGAQKLVTSADRRQTSLFD
ncbi:MAG TPA: hypothetical protein VFA04_02590 [Bryobacteraceae bacterium]|nr:hypothetical protein [Bryobacteraceae bacterium]